jgi:hypothetical protein
LPCGSHPHSVQKQTGALVSDATEIERSLEGAKVEAAPLEGYHDKIGGLSGDISRVVGLARGVDQNQVGFVHPQVGQ